MVFVYPRCYALFRCFCITQTKKYLLYYIKKTKIPKFGTHAVFLVSTLFLPHCPSIFLFILILVPGRLYTRQIKQQYIYELVPHFSFLLTLICCLVVSVLYCLLPPNSNSYRSRLPISLSVNASLTQGQSTGVILGGGEGGGKNSLVQQVKLIRTCR